MKPTGRRAWRKWLKRRREACMWAIRGVAMDPANQHPTRPGSEATESQLDRAPIGGQRHG